MSVGFARNLTVQPGNTTFGSASNLAQALNSSVEVDNSSGYSTIGFRLAIPTGATVAFEGTFDGTNWTSVRVRRIANDGYVNSTTVTDNYIGSISGLRKFRARVSVGGSAAGEIIGTLFNAVSTLEGIENGPPDEFYLKVSQGKVSGYAGNHKYGRNPDIDTTQEDIWGGGGTYTLSTSAETWYASSSSASDTAVVLTIEGLDSSYLETTRTVTLTGQTPVSISGGTLIRVNRVYNSSGTDLVGTAYLARSNSNHTAGVPQTATDIRAVLTPTEQQSTNSTYTVPAGKTAYFTGFTSDVSTGSATVYLLIRNFGSVFRARDIRTITGPTGVDYKIFIQIPEKSDIKFAASTSTNNTAVSVSYDVVLVDN